MNDQPQFLPGQVSPLVLFAAMAPLSVDEEYISQWEKATGRKWLSDPVEHAHAMREWRWYYATQMMKVAPPELIEPQLAQTSYSAANAAEMLGSKGALAIAEERLRQKSQERYTAERDDQYTQSQLAMAGAWYAIPPSESEACGALWPSDWDMPKDTHGENLTPAGRKRELAKAGALIAAEWDRIDRLELKL